MKKIVSLIFLIILLIIASVFLFAQNQNLKNEIGILNNKIADLEKQKSTNITPTPTAEKPPQGWKEYADNEYKFRVWYPEDINYGSKGAVLAGKHTERSNNFYNKEVTVVNFMKSTPEGKEEPVDLLYIYNK